MNVHQTSSGVDYDCANCVPIPPWCQEAVHSWALEVVHVEVILVTVEEQKHQVQTEVLLESVSVWSEERRRPAVVQEDKNYLQEPSLATLVDVLVVMVVMVVKCP